MQRAKQTGFTLVELLIVIVVIVILAALTIVAFNGLQNRARASEAGATLAQAKKKLALYKVDHGSYPAAGTLGAAGVTDNDVTFQYTSDGTSFCLTGTAGNTVAYKVTDNSTPEAGACTGHTAPGGGGGTPVASITIGSQTWAKNNLNVGTMIPGTTTQTNNSTLEKYCYNNTESNCSTYGGLYQWDEAMQYSTTEGAQGICPAGWHIPSDNDWKILEMALGMTQTQADAYGGRGTDQGTQLLSGGSSGINLPLAGWRFTDGFFSGSNAYAYVWTSSVYGSGDVWQRYIMTDGGQVVRTADGKTYGFTVRCLKN